MAITKASSNAVAPAAKGDLVVGNATNDSSVLAVGSTDQVLTVDSSTATGLKWATAAAGGGMTLISTTILSGSSTTISSIPSTYKHLYIYVRKTWTNAANAKISVDTDTTSSWTMQSNSIDTGGTFPWNDGGSGYSSGIIGVTGSSSGTGSYFVIDFPNYSDGAAVGSFFSKSIAFQPYIQNAGAFGDKSGTLTSITFATTSTFSGGTVFLYGVN